MDLKNTKNISKIEKENQKVKPSSTEKQWLLVTDKTNLFFRELKKEIREKFGMSLTYDKLVNRVIKDFNKNKFFEELKKIN